MSKYIYAPLVDMTVIKDIKEKIKSEKGTIALFGIVESGKAHLINGLSLGYKNTLIICENEDRARELHRDYKFFNKKAVYYPPKDFLFYEADLRGNLYLQERYKAIKAVLKEDNIHIITTIDSILDIVDSLDNIKKSIIKIDMDSEIDTIELANRLVSLGYERRGEASMPGEFAVRGDIVDVYSVTEENPIRISLWDTEIDSIKYFDSESQRSINNIEEVNIYPNKDRIGSDKCSLLDYLGKNTLYVFDDLDRIKEQGKTTCEELVNSIVEKGGSEKDAYKIIFPYKDIIKRLSKLSSIEISTFLPSKEGFNIIGQYEILMETVAPYHGGFELLLKDLEKYKTQGYKVILVSPSESRGKRLRDTLVNNGFNAFYSKEMDFEVKKSQIAIVKGYLRRGFLYPDSKFVFLTEGDIFGQKKEIKNRKRKSKDYIQDLSRLKVGDYIIYEKYGIGRYLGIEQISVEGNLVDYIKLEYGGGSNIYLPTTSLDLLQKYASKNSEDPPRLNKIGEISWTKTRGRVKKAVEKIAKELVELYAKRQTQSGYSCGPDTPWQREFEELFPYEETADQLAAIEDTKKDMESNKIMDRLICGDVGYGKTEIAIRAAFKEVQESRQVVYLAPTTILASQVYHNFKERMADFPVNIDLLCRFRSTKEQKETVEKIKEGQVDIIIGTHRLLSKDVEFANLGLLIIDEEQRFGVKHKERIKEIKTNIDVLTLTATPIPRTLHMGLIGIRDMSILTEPPMDRLPIQTYVMPYNKQVVKEAINRELRRGGQVYYVYNRVETIRDITTQLQDLFEGGINIQCAHGQMTKRELQNVMEDFINGEIDVLVSTTIIETGLDISNVNTMIIHDSNRYGLSQLYQLRGRIGRSNRTAYAFLMYQEGISLKDTAQKRLAAIREYTDLGSGFKIAMRDLELRGTGNLLGESQSGHIMSVGYDLYCKMLNQAIIKEKGEHIEEGFDTILYIKVSAFIPDEYVSSKRTKLSLYKRISRISSMEDYDEMIDEFIDRYGEIPKVVMNLLRIALLKSKAHKAYITEIKENDTYFNISIYNNARINAEKIPSLLKKYNRSLEFKVKDYKFILKKQGNSMDRLEDFLNNLQEIVEN